jgi:hypothetical protein
MITSNFKPGDRVDFCGIEAIVIANFGSSGTVEIPGEGRMSWYWEFDGEPVRLVEETPAKHVQTSGGICRKCSGFTTYTRQNSESGLCMKCETEGKQR